MSLCIIAGSFNHAIKKYIKYHNNENAINKMVINQLLLSMFYPNRQKFEKLNTFFDNLKKNG